MTIDQILARFSGVRRTRRGWRALCPSHNDQSPSLDIAVCDDERTLLVCRAGCRNEAIVRAVGLELRDLYPDRKDPGAGPRHPSRPAPVRSPLEEARRDVLRDAQRQLRRLEPFREQFADADLIRMGWRLVAEARRVATAMSPDEDRTWDLLAGAAAIETDTLDAEVSLKVATVTTGQRRTAP